MSDRPDKLYLCDFQGGEVFVNEIDLAMDDRLHNPTMYIKASDLAALVEEWREYPNVGFLTGDTPVQGAKEANRRCADELEQLLKRGE